MAEAPPPPRPLATPGPWTLVSAGYDRSTRDFLGKFSQWALEHLAPNGGDSSRMIDVACGPGTTSLLAQTRFSHIDAVDFSRGMLDQAARHVAEEGFDNIHLHEADGQDLPFASEIYDVAISMFGVMFFPDRKKGIFELFRVLKPGGQVALGSWAPADSSPLMQCMFEAIQVLDPSIPKVERDPTSHENSEVVQRELEDAGFVDVHVEQVEFGLSVENVRDFWSGAQEGTVPLVLLRKKLGEELWNERQGLVLQRLQDQLDVPLQLNSTAHIAIGRKPT